jgi:hypothetical protein
VHECDLVVREQPGERKLDCELHDLRSLRGELLVVLVGLLRGLGAPPARARMTYDLDHSNRTLTRPEGPHSDDALVRGRRRSRRPGDPGASVGAADDAGHSSITRELLKGQQ